MRTHVLALAVLIAAIPSPSSAQICNMPYALGQAEMTIAAGGELTPGLTSCPSPTGYSKHRLTVPAEALYFDTLFEMRPPTPSLVAEVFGSPPPPFPSRLAAILPGSARRVRAPADLEVEFHLADKPPGVPAAEMRAYRWLPSPTRHWEQLRGFGDAVSIPSGAYLAEGPVDSFDSRSFYAAQLGAVTILTPAPGALIAGSSVTVTGKVRFFDLSQGTTRPCAQFALTVNGQSVTPSCTTGNFSTNVSFASDGVHAIEARLEGPSKDVSIDEVVVETDATPPLLVATDPEHEDTFTSDVEQVLRGWYEEAHPPVTALVTVTAPVPADPCDEPDCFSYTHEWAANPAGQPVLITLTDSLGNTANYNLTLYPMELATVYGLLLDALVEVPPEDLIAGMPIEVQPFGGGAPIASGTSASPSWDVEGTRVNYSVTAAPDLLNGMGLYKFRAGAAPTTPNNCDCLPTECPYAGFGLVADVRLKRGLFVLNAAPREPVRLPPIQACHGEVIGPGNTDPNCVTTSDIDVIDPDSGTTLHVLAWTQLTFANGICAGTLSVTEVPRDKTPQSLPPDMVPSIIVTIQPSELRFEPPPKITFPNRVYSPAPGSPARMTLYSVDPRTDVFMERGPMEVIGEPGSGTIVSLANTGVGIAGWHCPHSPTLGGSGGGAGRGGGCDPETACCPAGGDGGAGRSQGGPYVTVGSEASLFSGELVLGYTPPTYRSLGQTRGLTFAYSSNSVNPWVLEPFDITLGPNTIIPQSITLQYSFLSEGGLLEGPQSVAGTTELNAANKGTGFRYVGAVNTAWSVSTGLVATRLQGVSRYALSSSSSPATGDPREEDCGDVQENRGTTLFGTYPHVDLSASPYGAGWGIRGISRLYAGDYRVLIVDGNGDRLLFEPAASSGPMAEDLFLGPSDDAAAAEGALLNRRADGPAAFEPFPTGPCEDLKLLLEGDFNGDAVADVLGLQYSGGSAMYVWIGRDDPAHPFEDLLTEVPTSGNLATHNVAIADFDGSGHDDIVAEQQGNAGGYWVRIYLRDGETFSEGPQIETGLSAHEGHGTVAGDFDEDGNPDVGIFGTAIDSSGTRFPLLRVLRGDGADGLDAANPIDTALPSVGLFANGGRVVQVLDLDRRGHLDLLFPSDAGLYAMWGDGNGAFDPGGQLLYSSDWWNSNSVAVADLRGGGQDDLVFCCRDGVGNEWSQDLVILSGSDRGWTVVHDDVSFAVPDSPILRHGRVGVGDFDLDGVADIAVSGDPSWDPLDVDVPVRLLIGFGDLQYDEASEHPESMGTDCGQGWRDGQAFLAGRWGEVGGSGSSPSGEFVSRIDRSRIRPAEGGWERTYPDGTVSRYDGAGFLVETEDLNGNLTSYRYNAAGALESLIDAAGLETRLEYEPSAGLLSKLIDPAGRETVFSHDGERRLTVIQDPEMHETRFDYELTDPNWKYLITARTPPRGDGGTELTTHYVYDQDYGRLKESHLPREGEVDDNRFLSPLVLQGAFGPGGMTGCDGGPITLVPDVRATFGNDEVPELETYVLSCDGRMLSKTVKVVDPDPLLNDEITWELVPDAAGRILKSTRPDGTEVTVGYDGRGSVVRRTEVAEDATVRTEYHPDFARPTRVFAADPGSCTGPLVEVIYDLDGRGNPVEIKRNELSETTYIDYDSKGRPVLVIDASDDPSMPLHATRFEYDDATGLGNLSAVIQDLPSGGPLVTRLEYDGAGSLTRVTDAKDRVTTFEYDGNGRLTRIVDADLEETVLGYDLDGNLTLVHDAKDQETTFTYDVRDRLESRKVHAPAGDRTEWYTYTATDELATFTDRQLRVTEFLRDSLGRLRKKTLPGGEGEYEYRYDARSRVRYASGPTGAPGSPVHEFDYSTPRQVVEEVTAPWGSATLTSLFDRNGFRTSFQAKRGLDETLLEMAWTPDCLGRVAEVKREGDVVAKLDYDAVGRREKLHHLAGIAELGLTRYTHDDIGRLLEVSNEWPEMQVVSKFVYSQYDAVGNYAHRFDQRSGQPDEDRYFEHDDLDRLLDVDDGENNDLETMTYDGVGNRETYWEGTNQQDWTYVTPNRITSDAVWSYLHDDNGNQTQKSQPGALFNYIWTTEDRLKEVRAGGSLIGSAAYDAFGRRIEKTWTGAVRRYLYDGADIIAEFDGGGTNLATYVHGPSIDEPLIMKRGGVEYQYLADGLGSITEVLQRSDGAIQNRYRYRAFGRTEALAYGVESPYGFTGREWEREWVTDSGSELSLYHYRARYFDPRLGRFIGEDPIGFAGGDVNLYSYVSNRPLLQTDPSGQCIVVAIPLLLPVIGEAIGWAALVAILTKAISDVLPPTTTNSDDDDCTEQCLPYLGRGRQYRGNDGWTYINDLGGPWAYWRCVAECEGRL